MKTKKQEFIDNLGLSELGIKLLDAVINEAIAEAEASGWKKYPENKPEVGNIYFAQYEDGDISKVCCTSLNAWDKLPIIAFRELPEPYQEGGEG